MAGMRSARVTPEPRDARRWPGVRTALAAVAALAVASCAGGPASGPSSTGPSRSPTILTACTVGGQTARCGYVWVAQDWAHPHGPQMPLEVAVLPAGTTHPAADPVFYLAGVGGQSVGDGDALENGFTWASQAFSQLNRTRDLVFVEQRGTPGSGLQTCSGLSAVHNLAALRAWVRRCLASARRDPRHDTTLAAARDLDQVRKALGYTKINIYGPSYGVTIGLAYLQRYSAHVRTAVFDSGSLLNVRLEQLAEAHTLQAFDQVARDCATDPACARAYHPAVDLHTILAHLKAHPARVSLPRPGFTAASPQKVTITVPLFLQITSDEYLASALTAIFLPADLQAMARGQWQQVINKREYTTGILPAPGPLSLQYLTIGCSDTWAAVDPAKVRQQAARCSPRSSLPPPPKRSRRCAPPGRTTPARPGPCTAASRSCSSTAPSMPTTRRPTSPPPPGPCPTRYWSPSPAPPTGSSARRSTPAAWSPPPQRSSNPASPPTRRPGRGAPAPWPTSPWNSPHHEQQVPSRCAPQAQNQAICYRRPAAISPWPGAEAFEALKGGSQMQS